MSDDRDDFVERAKSADILAVAEAMGAKLKKIGATERAGPCPACGGTDRFSISTRDRVFNCRGSGGGDIIAMAAHIQGLDTTRDFIRICELILDEPTPDQKEPARPRDPAVAKERKEERRDEDRAREKQESAERAAKAGKAQALFDSGIPIEGTLAQDYLEDWRGLDLRAFSTTSLRFRNDLDYWGYPAPTAVAEDGSPLDPEMMIKLGTFPCMLAAMRDLSGRIIGVKRTYLDMSGRKLSPPGRRGNKTKLGVGNMSGGLIYLDDDIGDTLAIGEGLETTIAWRGLAREQYLFGDLAATASIACADSLGNLTGDKLQLPPQVRRLIFLGDGDSCPVTTRQLLLKAAERARGLGIEPYIHMAPTVEPHARDWKLRGKDWDDVLKSHRERRAA